MNEQLFDVVNDQAGSVSALDSLAKFFAVYGLYVLVGIVAVLGVRLLLADRQRGLMVGAVGALALGLAGLGILAASSVVTEDRPFVHDSDTALLIAHGADNSFPSDHSTIAAAIAVVGALAWRRLWPLFAGLAAAVGFARIYVGVHFPGDVAAGWAIGALAALLAWYAVQLILTRWRPRVAAQG